MTVDRAPVTVIAPDGTTYEPVRLVADETSFTVTDKYGAVIASGAVTSLSAGARIVTIDGPDGRWTGRNLCSCGSRKRALMREWYGTNAA